MTVELHAYRYSVYSWIARLVLGEKHVPYDYVEVDPFAATLPAGYLAKHPFGRVPALAHDGFALYETAAISRYVDETFPGAALQPSDSRSRARLVQIIAVIDAYGYWPMVRQVFSHAVFRPRAGRPADAAEVTAGLIASRRVIDALEALCGDGGYLVGEQLSLADLHVAPMMAYFIAADAGRGELERHPKLSAWWDSMRSRPIFKATEPELPG